MRTAIARPARTSASSARCSSDIHPPSLSDAGLDAALHDLVNRASAAAGRREVELPVDGAIAAPRTQLVYRVASEALRNVQAHAGATRAVRVRTRSRPGSLGVTDDGRGFGDDDHARGAREDGSHRPRPARGAARSRPAAASHRLRPEDRGRRFALEVRADDPCS